MDHNEIDHNEIPEGLGDSVEKFTKATGIRKVVEDCRKDRKTLWLQQTQGKTK